MAVLRPERSLEYFDATSANNLIPVFRQDNRKTSLKRVRGMKFKQRTDRNDIPRSDLERSSRHRLVPPRPYGEIPDLALARLGLAFLALFGRAKCCFSKNWINTNLK